MLSDDLTSEEMAMIREILRRHLPFAMLGVGDAHFESPLNMRALSDSLANAGGALGRSNRTGSSDLEGKKGALEPDER
jgi:hypothetical protein